jgi:hypothetical protein
VYVISVCIKEDLVIETTSNGCRLCTCSCECICTIEDVEVKINLTDNTEFDYISLSGDMLDVRIHTVVDDVRAVIRIEFIEELNYPLMYVEEI